MQVKGHTHSVRAGTLLNLQSPAQNRPLRGQGECLNCGSDQTCVGHMVGAAYTGISNPITDGKEEVSADKSVNN